MSTADTQLAHLAGGQYGAFSVAQAANLGMNRKALRHRVKQGRLVRLHPASYAVGGSPAIWERSLSAALLAVGPGALGAVLSADEVEDALDPGAGQATDHGGGRRMDAQ